MKGLVCIQRSGRGTGDDAMNVAMMSSDNMHTGKMRQAIEEAVPGLTLMTWKSGERAPAESVEVLLAMGAVTREDMESLPGLALVQTLSDGYEKVDVEAATELGIWVSYAPAEVTGNGDSVAEFAVLLLLATARRLGTALAATRDGSVKKPADAVTLLAKTALIVGVGHIGEMIAQRLATFGMRVIGVDRLPLMAARQIPTRPLEQMDEALAESDFVVICIRGSKENQHMFNSDRFKAMKPGAIMVNIARGSLVDEEALYDAVKSGHLGGAGLDVLEEEPIDAANPLLTLPQVIVTPHLAGMTDLTSAGTTEYVAYVLREFAEGSKVKSVLNRPETPRRTLKE